MWDGDVRLHRACGDSVRFAHARDLEPLTREKAVIQLFTHTHAYSRSNLCDRSFLLISSFGRGGAPVCPSAC